MNEKKSKRLKVLLLQSMSEVQNNFVPLGLAYLGAVFEKNDCQVKIIDASAPYANYEIEDLLEEVKDFQPNLIGITLTITYANYSYQLISQISKISDAFIVVGGPHATILPHEPLQQGAHVVVRGEGENACLDLIRYLKREINLSQILGISYYNQNKEIVDNPPRPQIENLDSIPFPAKHLFRKKDFIKSPSDLIRFSNIMTGRGCPGMCTYCSNKLMWGRLVRYRSTENILSEIKLLRDTYGIKRFNFFDDSFTFNQKRTYELCDGLIKELPEIKWNCITRVDFVDKELLKKMAEAGCEHINYGLESGDIETLIKIKKMITPEQAEQVLRWTKESGMTAGVNFMHGFPWDTPEKIQRTQNFIRKISSLVRDIMAGGILIPYPGTEIYEEYKDKYGFKEWWLKGKVLTSEKLGLSTPLFEKIFFYYDTLRYNYFHYPKRIVDEIKKTARQIGRHNLLFYAKEISSWPFCYLIRELIFILVLISQALYKLSPALERTAMRPFLMIASRKEVAIRSKNNEN